MERRYSVVSTTKAGPCITLLQERFRQLKRQREEREENIYAKKKVLLSGVLEKQISESRGLSYATNDLIFPPKTSVDDPLSLGLNNLNTKVVDYRDFRNQILLDKGKRMDASTSKKFEPRNVDTSLRL